MIAIGSFAKIAEINTGKHNFFYTIGSQVFNIFNHIFNTVATAFATC